MVNTDSSSDNNSIEFESRSGAKKKWTVMVYMAADNDLEYFGVEDLNEMERVGSTEDVNMIVQFDRHPRSDSTYSGSNGDWKDTRRFYVQKDNDTRNFFFKFIALIFSKILKNSLLFRGFILYCR